MIVMSGNERAAVAYQKSIDEAMELVPGARALYEANKLDGLLARLNIAKNAAYSDALKLRDQAKATSSEEERKELEEEASDVEQAGHIIGRGALALDLCATQETSH